MLRTYSFFDTDASDYAIGAELSQLQNGKEVLISYGIKTISSPEAILYNKKGTPSYHCFHQTV
jgi:hypothetical protein